MTHGEGVGYLLMVQSVKTRTVKFVDFGTCDCYGLTQGVWGIDPGCRGIDQGCMGIGPR